MSNELTVRMDFAEMRELATAAAKTAMVPTQFRNKPAECLVAMQYGAELGLHPLQSLQSIAVINGRPSVYGDTMIAIVKASGQLADIDEWMESADDDDDTAAFCKVVRRGTDKPVVRAFSVGDAKQAKLWGKQGPWTQYPRRMLQMRARAWALRDVFADVLAGIGMTEEVRDIPVSEPATAETLTRQIQHLPMPVESEPEPEEPESEAAADDPPVAKEIDKDKSKLRAGQWQMRILEAKTMKALATVGNGIKAAADLTDEHRADLREFWTIRQQELEPNDDN